MPNLSKFLYEVGAYGYQKPNWFEFRMTTPPPGLSGQPPGSEYFEGSTADALTEQQAKDRIAGGVAEIITVADGGLGSPSFQAFLREGFVCTSGSLPGRSFTTVEQTIYGFERKIPTKSMYNPLSCTFLTPIGKTGKNIALEFFQKWQNVMQNTENPAAPFGVDMGPGSFDLQFPNRIYGEAEIFQYSFIDLVENKSKFQLNVDVDLGRFGSFDLGKALGLGKDSKGSGGETRRQVSLRHRFTELYPITVGETRLDWGATSEYSQLDVTFNYSYWVDMATGVDVKDNIFGYPEKSFEEKFWNKAKNIAIGQAIRNNWIK